MVKFSHFYDRSKSPCETSLFQHVFQSFRSFETFWLRGLFFPDRSNLFPHAPKRYLWSWPIPKYRLIPLLTLPLILSLSLLCYSYTFFIPAEKVFPPATPYFSRLGLLASAPAPLHASEFPLTIPLSVGLVAFLAALPDRF